MTANRPQPRPGVLDIAPYVPGKSTAPGVAKVFKLSSNETPLGPSPNAIAAYRAVGEHLEDYPDGSASTLREAIGDAFGLDPDRIVCGAGSDDLLNLLARAYLGDGDEGDGRGEQIVAGRGVILRLPIAGHAPARAGIAINAEQAVAATGTGDPELQIRRSVGNRHDKSLPGTRGLSPSPAFLSCFWRCRKVVSKLSLHQPMDSEESCSQLCAFQFGLVTPVKYSGDDAVIATGR